MAPSRREDLGQRGPSGDEPGQERLDRGRCTLDLHEHALSVVADMAGQPELRGQPVHEGAEPDSLHDAHHPDPPAHRGVRRGHGGHGAS